MKNNPAVEFAKEQDKRRKLKEYIEEWADYKWIGEFVNDVLEYDWLSDLDEQSTDKLEELAQELGWKKSKKVV